jgi:hypothetical protein
MQSGIDVTIGTQPLNPETQGKKGHQVFVRLAEGQWENYVMICFAKLVKS